MIRDDSYFYFKLFMKLVPVNRICLIRKRIICSFFPFYTVYMENFENVFFIVDYLAKRREHLT